MKKTLNGRYSIPPPLRSDTKIPGSATDQLYNDTASVLGEKSSPGIKCVYTMI